MESIVAGYNKPNDGDDRMDENDEDVVHAGIVPKSEKIPESRLILQFHGQGLKPEFFVTQIVTL